MPGRPHRFEVDREGRSFYRPSSFHIHLRAGLIDAQGTCNSIRGTRPVAGVRLELAGTAEAPMGAGEKTAWSLGGGAVAGVTAGFVWARQRPDGSRQFNPQAALIAGGLVALALRLAL